MSLGTKERHPRADPIACSRCGAEIHSIEREETPLCLICRAAMLAANFQGRRTPSPSKKRRSRGWLRMMDSGPVWGNLLDAGPEGFDLRQAPAANQCPKSTKLEVVTPGEVKRRAKKYCPRCHDRVRHADARCRHCRQRLRTVPLLIFWALSISLAVAGFFLLLNYLGNHTSSAFWKIIQARRPVINCTISRITAITRIRWISPPPTLSAKPSSQRMTRITRMVQSISFYPFVGAIDRQTHSSSATQSRSGRLSARQDFPFHSLAPNQPGSIRVCSRLGLGGSRNSFQFNTGSPSHVG